MNIKALLSVAVVLVLGAASPAATSEPAIPAPTLAQVVDRMAAYVASYGAEAAMFVAAEHYEQRVATEDRLLRPRTLTSEFALVNVPGTVSWAGYRDVVEVNDKLVADRRDRLQSLLTGPEAAAGQLKRIVAESARYNVGPVARDLNVPTTALFFFHPARVSRFAFEHKGTKTIEKARVWQVDFKETARPTLVMRRDGTDVPAEGTVWVVPEDGTVVRTRVRFRNFADIERLPELEAPATTPIEVVPSRGASPVPGQGTAPSPAPGQPGGTGSGTGGSGYAGGAAGSAPPPPPPPPPPREPARPLGQTGRIETMADIEVTYRRHAEHGVWLPAKMSEIYEGPIPRGTAASIPGRATGQAEYSNYRRFATSARIVPAK